MSFLNSDGKALKKGWDLESGISGISSKTVDMAYVLIFDLRYVSFIRTVECAPTDEGCSKYARY
jgi:hypothetical protein